jgi:hypothetical protein
MPWKKGQSGNPLGRLPGEKQFATTCSTASLLQQCPAVLCYPFDLPAPADSTQYFFSHSSRLKTLGTSM